MNEHGEPGKPGGEGKGPWGGVGGEGGAGGAGPGGGVGGGGGTGGAGGTVGERLHPRRAALLTWFWLTVITGLTAWALLSFGETQGDVEDQADRIEEVATEGRDQIILAGERSVFQGCIRDVRDTQRQIRSSNRNIPALVRQGALSPAVGRLARVVNKERRARATEASCERQKRQFRRTALNG